MERSDGVLVPVTGLSSLVAYPGEVYDRFVLRRGQVPTSSMISGELEHLARQLLVGRLWKVYLSTQEGGDLRVAFESIEAALHEASRVCERKYLGLFAEARNSIFEITNRLRIEEDVRMVAATSLLRDGVTGFELVRRLLPQRVEVTLESRKLGLVGRVDAVGERNGVQFPIEYKTGREPSALLAKSHEIQVAAYSMLLEEESGNACNFGEVHYTRYLQVRPVAVNVSARREVLKLRARFLKICGAAALHEVPTMEVAHV